MNKYHGDWMFCPKCMARHKIHWEKIKENLKEHKKEILEEK